MLHTLVFQMTDRTQTLSRELFCHGFCSRGYRDAMPHLLSCHHSGSCPGAGLSSTAGVEQLLVSEDGGALCSQELQQHGHHCKGWAKEVHTRSFSNCCELVVFFFFLFGITVSLHDKSGLWTKEHASDLQNKALADYSVGFAQFTVALLKMSLCGSIVKFCCRQIREG